jgi:hypothetical protein
VEEIVLASREVWEEEIVLVSRVVRVPIPVEWDPASPCDGVVPSERQRVLQRYECHTQEEDAIFHLESVVDMVAHMAVHMAADMAAGIAAESMADQDK